MALDSSVTVDRLILGDVSVRTQVRMLEPGMGVTGYGHQHGLSLSR